MVLTKLLMLFGKKRQITSGSAKKLRLPRRKRWTTFDRTRFSIIFFDGHEPKDKVNIEGESNTMNLFFYFMQLTCNAARQHRDQGKSVSVKDTGRYCIRLYLRDHKHVASFDRFNFSVLPDHFSEILEEIRTMYKDIEQEVNRINLFSANTPTPK